MCEYVVSSHLLLDQGFDDEQDFDDKKEFVKNFETKVKTNKFK